MKYVVHPCVVNNVVFVALICLITRELKELFSIIFTPVYLDLAVEKRFDLAMPKSFMKKFLLSLVIV